MLSSEHAAVNRGGVLLRGPVEVTPAAARHGGGPRGAARVRCKKPENTRVRVCYVLVFVFVRSIWCW